VTKTVHFNLHRTQKDASLMKHPYNIKEDGVEIGSPAVALVWLGTAVRRQVARGFGVLVEIKTTVGIMMFVELNVLG